jgi:protein SCO1/2
MRRAIGSVIVLVTLAAGLTGLVFAMAKGQQPVARVSDDSALAFRPHPGARLPLTTKLMDERGRPVALGRYFTKSPVILVLEYLRCTSLCGVTLRNLVAGTLRRVPLEPSRDYQLVAISIDPRDKPSDAATARAKYAGLLARSGAEDGIHFLTGSTAAVRAIADAVGFPYRYDALLQAYIHPAGFIIASPDGVISHYVEGLAITPQGLISAFADAEQDKSTGPLTRLFLLCHVRGAPLGRFTAPVLAAFTMADLAAGLTLIAIFTAIRRRRHG